MFNLVVLLCKLSFTEPANLCYVQQIAVTSQEEWKVVPATSCYGAIVLCHVWWPWFLCLCVISGKAPPATPVLDPTPGLTRGSIPTCSVDMSWPHPYCAAGDVYASTVSWMQAEVAGMWHYTISGEGLSKYVVICWLNKGQSGLDRVRGEWYM
jgi:hypothetical protein